MPILPTNNQDTFIRIINNMNYTDVILISSQNFTINLKTLTFAVSSYILSSNVTYYLSFDDGVVAINQTCKLISLFNHTSALMRSHNFNFTVINIESELKSSSCDTIQFIVLVTTLSIGCIGLHFFFFSISYKKFSQINKIKP